MYSFLLMTAVAAGGDAPASGWGLGCSGGSCSGVVVSGCSGAVPVGCCGGVVTTSCYGGCGGRSLFPLFPRLRARLAARFSCGGCSGFAVPASCHGGSCVGSACYGGSCTGSSCLGYGFGGCGGCSGYYAGSVPGGAGYGNSAPGGVYYMGNMPGVSAATFGFGFAGLPTFPQGYSMGGCFGTGVVGPHYYGSDYNNPPVSVIPPGAPSVVPPALNRNESGETDQMTALDYRAASAKPAAAPARLTLELPANAVLFVDGELVTGTGPTRNFHTPSLPAGTYFYDLKAVVRVNDEPVTETVRVTVQAGDAKSYSFGKLLAAVKGESPAVVSK